ncbi:hypothetical protein BEH_26370 (plasmid) [Priestia filamentosa]|uniref:Uncharacterized protein n=1 Tax=Priestia filamentosa TaxID=1402861 RepID=A0A2S1LZS0_9BACI|nr:hypothetical protein [Priestia filamentosa]AWG44313.1 hypothetical protein BEH_26370 [Priestia filamentosa]
MKKLTKIACSLALAGVLSTTAVSAATSKVYVGGSNVAPTGSTISASRIVHTGENYGSVTFNTYAMKSRAYLVDSTISSRALYGGDELYTTASPGSGKYYVKAKVTGSGAYYASGVSAVYSN